MGRRRNPLNIQHGQRRIGQRLAEHTPGIGLKQAVELIVRRIGIKKGDFNSHLLHRFVKQIKGAAVNRAGTEQVPSRWADIEHRDHTSRLPGGGQHGAYAPFQIGNFLLNRFQRGIAQPGIKMPAFLQIKESAHCFSRVVLKGGALINREDARLSILRLPARLDAFGIDVAHGLGTPFCAGLPGVSSNRTVRRHNDRIRYSITQNCFGINEKPRNSKE